MSSAKKLLEAAAGTAAAGGATDISDVFRTYVYTGNGGTQTITNDIDLNGKGGLVWVKSRNYTYGHALSDTEHTVGNYMSSDTTDQIQGGSNAISAFNSNGFSLGNDSYLNGNNSNIVSWTWRKAPRFFDVVTYTGNGASSRAISHALNSVPGVIIIKRTSSGSENWIFFHRSISNSSNGKNLFLNTNNSESDMSGKFDQSNLPTSQTFTIGNDNSVNADGSTYVAYLFANNNNDGEFGPDADQDIIKCGSYTGNGTTSNAQTEQNGPEINLGWEPQFVIIKKASASGEWYLFDTIRGFTVYFSGAGKKFLYPNKSNAETSLSADYAYLKITSTGFKITAGAGALFNDNNESYIYMAIRAPMITEPEAATEVFSMQATGSSGLPIYKPANGANTRVDFAFMKGTGVEPWYLSARLIQDTYLQPQTQGVASSSANFGFDYNLGWYSGGDSPRQAWMWKRAKGYFDVVGYRGTGSARTVAHSLGVAPEMMWVKGTNVSDHWHVYQKDITPDYYLIVNDTGVPTDSATIWNDTNPTSSVFTVGTNGGVNGSNYYYIAYLFATLAGISKVGSVSHSGSSTDVNCGFSNGARFVILKRTDAVGGWYVFDTVQGIVAGNDPYMLLNSTAAEVTNTDYIDPLSSGFTITGDFTDGDYIFYAIA